MDAEGGWRLIPAATSDGAAGWRRQTTPPSPPAPLQRILLLHLTEHLQFQLSNRARS